MFISSRSGFDPRDILFDVATAIGQRERLDSLGNELVHEKLDAKKGQPPRRLRFRSQPRDINSPKEKQEEPYGPHKQNKKKSVISKNQRLVGG